MAKMMNIVVLDGYTLNPGDLSWEKLLQTGNCRIYDHTPPDKILERIKDASIVLTNKVIINRKVMALTPNLKYIGVLATGYNIIDINAASEYGITVTNIPAYSTNSVAQLVFAHLLTITNRVELHSQSVHSGNWQKSIHFSYSLSSQTELHGKILGIIGFGQIGQKVAQIALAFGMKVIFYSPSQKQITDDRLQQVALEKVFAESDIVSLNCPLTNENQQFVNASLLSSMKKSAILINTGRGGLINEKDLAHALNSGQIAAAGLDVIASEPPVDGSPLFQAKNCFITPHIAWASYEARNRLMEIAINNVRAYINNVPENTITPPLL